MMTRPRGGGRADEEVRDREAYAERLRLTWEDEDAFADFT